MNRGLDVSVFVKMAGDLVKPLKDAENVVAKSTERMKKNLTLSVGLAGAGAVAGGIKMATDGIVANFTQSYKEVQKASGDLRSLGMQDMRAVIAEGQALQSTYVGLTTEAFVRAAYDIKSGVSSLTDEGVAAMTASALTVAKATKGMPESMTSLFATSYGIFKKQFSDMADADWGDMFGAALSKSVQQFKTDGAKMQQAIESAGAGATNLGMKMTEQMTLLGMMQQQMQAGEAGTALRAFATNSAKAHEAFGKLAKTTKNKVVVRVLDENGQMRAMPDILTDLKARYGETLDAFEAAEIGKAFGTEEAMKLINALYGQEEAVRANAAALDDAAAQGAEFTENMAANVDDYDGASWELLGQQMDVIKQKIGAGLLPAMDKLAPILGNMAEGVGNFISKNPDLVAGLGAAIVGFGGIATVAAPVLFGLSAVTATFGTLRHGSTLLNVALRGTSSKAGMLARGAGKLGGALGLLKTVAIGLGRALLMNPIGLAVTAIAGGAYLIWRNWEPIKAFFVNLWQGVKSATSAAWDWIKNAFMAYHPAGIIYTHWDSITGWFSGLWDRVKAGVSTGWEGIKSMFFKYHPAGIIYTNWDGISAWFGRKWTDLKAGVSTGWGAIKTAISTYHPAMIIYRNWDGITTWFDAKWQAVKAGFTTQWDSIKATVATWPADFMQFGKDMIQGLIDGIAAKAKALKDSITGVGSATAGWFKEKLGIKSPSRVFMGFGSNISEGLAIGINKDAIGVFASLDRIRKGITKPMMGAAKVGLAGVASAAIGTASPALAGAATQVQSVMSAGANGASLHFAPVLNMNMGGGVTPDAEMQMRALFEKLTRDAARELERLYSDAD